MKKHPLQEVWDKKNQITERIGMIYSYSPFVAKTENGNVEIITTVSEENKKVICELEQIRDSLADIEFEYYTNKSLK